MLLFETFDAVCVLLAHLIDRSFHLLLARSLNFLNFLFPALLLFEELQIFLIKLAPQRSALILRKNIHSEGASKCVCTSSDTVHLCLYSSTSSNGIRRNKHTHRASDTQRHIITHTHAHSQNYAINKQTRAKLYMRIIHLTIVH